MGERPEWKIQLWVFERVSSLPFNGTPLRTPRTNSSLQRWLVRGTPCSVVRFYVLPDEWKKKIWHQTVTKTIVSGSCNIQQYFELVQVLSWSCLCSCCCCLIITITWLRHVIVLHVRVYVNNYSVVYGIHKWIELKLLHFSNPYIEWERSYVCISHTKSHFWANEISTQRYFYSTWFPTWNYQYLHYFIALFDNSC